jgi:hypothetical protein
MVAPGGGLPLLAENRAVGPHALMLRLAAQTASRPTAESCGGLLFFGSGLPAAGSPGRNHLPPSRPDEHGFLIGVRNDGKKPDASGIFQ